MRKARAINAHSHARVHSRAALCMRARGRGTTYVHRRTYPSARGMAAPLSIPAAFIISALCLRLRLRPCHVSRFASPSRLPHRMPYFFGCPYSPASPSIRRKWRAVSVDEGPLQKDGTISVRPVKIDVAGQFEHESCYQRSKLKKFRCQLTLLSLPLSLNFYWTKNGLEFQPWSFAGKDNNVVVESFLHSASLVTEENKLRKINKADEAKR